MGRHVAAAGGPVGPMRGSGRDSKVPGGSKGRDSEAAEALATRAGDDDAYEVAKTSSLSSCIIICEPHRSTQCTCYSTTRHSRLQVNRARPGAGFPGAYAAMKCADWSRATCDRTSRKSLNQVGYEGGARTSMFENLATLRIRILRKGDMFSLHAYPRATSCHPTATTPRPRPDPPLLSV
eukprot:2528747-Pyramimonas_sp.AAC.1